MLKADILRAYNLVRGGKFKRAVLCVRSPGVQATVVYRFGHWLRGRRLLRILLMPLYLWLHYRVVTKWGIDVASAAKIGEGCYIGHFGGIIIGPGVEIGRNVTLSQGVTIGVAGRGQERGSPVFGDNVYIAPGAKIFGKIRVGNNVRIGANAVIHKDVPDHSVVVLCPGFEILADAEEPAPEAQAR